MAETTQLNKRKYISEKEVPQTEPTLWQKLRDWESYPKNIFLLPLYFFGIFKAITNRTMWLFSTGNPELTFGSFFGLTKSEIYDILPAGTYPDSVLIPSNNTFTEALAKIKSIGLEYPFIAKPDVGMVGLLVRVIEDEEQLRAYHEKVKANWIVQSFVPYDVEIGLFYVRQPGAAKGRIAGLSEKKPLSIIGNGISTIGALVKKGEKTRKFEDEIFKRQMNQWNRVPAKGEFVQLIYTGNRKTGASLVERMDEVDEDLLAIFDEISHYKNKLYFGRFDIKCESLEDLKQGKNFAILEFNGVHSGYGHLYHCGKSTMEAYRAILKLWAELYNICIANAERGHRFTPFWEGWKTLSRTIRHFYKLTKWEKELP